MKKRFCLLLALLCVLTLGGCGDLPQTDTPTEQPTQQQE